MENMPPVTLGATILVPLITVLAFRQTLEKRLVCSVGAFKQTSRQFQLDLSLFILVGCCVALYNYLVHGFPISSAVSFIFGCLVMGFFIALDTALWRERNLIRTARMEEALLIPPERLYPMSRRFSSVAVATALFVIEVMALVISRDFAWLNSMEMDAAMLSEAQRSVMTEVVFITFILLAMVVNLIISYSKNLSLLFRNETGVLEKVSQGDLTAMVPVVTQDEFGLIAGHTNVMIEGLRHRSELVSSIKLAEEVQRNLLPVRPPEVEGVDLAGASRYCDETGGDYYDYFRLSDHRLVIVVADAADHGLGSAMHMTSARAFLRAAMDHYQSPEQIVSEINRYLVQDGRNTGRFMTLFFLEIDSFERRLRWVRAGHDPAILFDPTKKRLEVLDGPGVALGVSDEMTYVSQSLTGWSHETVLLIGTDGIWETRNHNNEMFGRSRLYQIIKDAAAKRKMSRQLMEEILAQVASWRGDQKQEDDITLVTAVLS